MQHALMDEGSVGLDKEISISFDDHTELKVQQGHGIRMMMELMGFTNCHDSNFRLTDEMLILRGRQPMLKCGTQPCGIESRTYEKMMFSSVDRCKGGIISTSMKEERI